MGVVGLHVASFNVQGELQGIRLSLDAPVAILMNHRYGRVKIARGRPRMRRDLKRSSLVDAYGYSKYDFGFDTCIVVVFAVYEKAGNLLNL